MSNTRLNLPPYISRKLKILSAHREISAPTIVFDLIEKEYETLGLDEPEEDELAWKAPEARR